MTKEDIENFDKVYIVACGTAYHAGLVGKLVIEKMAKCSGGSGCGLGIPIQRSVCR